MTVLMTVLMTVEDSMGDAQAVPVPNDLAEDLAYRSFLFWETLAEMEADEIERVPLGGSESGSGETAKLQVARMAVDDERSLQRLQAAIAGPQPADAPQTDDLKAVEARLRELAGQSWSEVQETAQRA